MELASQFAGINNTNEFSGILKKGCPGPLPSVVNLFRYIVSHEYIFIVNPQ